MPPALLLKQTGAVSERYSYDAWGRRRNPATARILSPATARFLSRGGVNYQPSLIYNPCRYKYNFLSFALRSLKKTIASFCKS